MAVNITNMVVIRGIVISASKTRAKATKIAVRCKVSCRRYNGGKGYLFSG